MLIFGRKSGLLCTVALLATLVGTVSNAQGLRDSRGPAEFPPASFSANQYVDSRGCVFVRAGISGSVNWVPRVSRNREQLCGFQPSNVAGATDTAPAVDAPNPLDTQVAGLPPRTETAARPTARPTPEPVVEAPAAVVPDPAPAVRAPVVAAAPVPSVTVPVAPTNTRGVVNPLTSQPATATTRPAQVAAVAPSPRVITAPSTQPRVITRAQACAGLTGVQPNLISQRTGEPIDCGGAAAPQVAAVAPSPRVITAPSTQPRVITRAQACAGLTGVQPNLISQRTGEPIDCGGATAPQVAAVTAPVEQAPAVQTRLTRTQACADFEATGRQYISAISGLPVRCGPQAQAIGTFAGLQADLALPQRPYSNPLDSAPGSTFVPNRPQVATTSNRIPYSNPLDAAPGSTFTPNVNTRLAASCSFGGTSGSAGFPARCGPQAEAPSGRTITATVSRARTSPSSQGIFADLTNQNPPPYSNPPRGYALPAPTVPSGYARVWGDGRLNTQRGLPTGLQAQSPTNNQVQYATTPRTQAVEQPRVATPVAAPTQRAEQLSGHRYVQVGTYETRNQAQSIAQALRSRGLPMRIGVFNQNGREMRLVLAGPFGSDNQLQSALGTARGAGFSGAFTRR